MYADNTAHYKTIPAIMVEEQQGSQHNRDDLDLMRLLEKMFGFFRRYGLLILLFSVAGIAFGYISYKSAPKRYASTLLLHSFTLANTEHINIIENWNDLLKGEEYEVLAQRLNCDAGMLKKVSNITASEIQKLYIPNNPNGFMVEVMVKDNAILDTLQKGIVYGLENSDYMKAKLASRRANLTELISKVNAEIIKLDSTKRNIENGINNNTQHSSSFIIDASNINTQMIGLNEKLLDYQEQLRFSNAVQVLHQFEKFQKPAAPKFLKSVVLGLIGGFALGYILAVFLYCRKRFARRKG